MIKKPNWRIGGGLGENQILEGSGFYISFSTGMVGIPFLGSDTDSGETAICKNGRYYILNGDHRKEYEKIINQGLDACIDYFKKNKSTHGSSWTDKED